MVVKENLPVVIYYNQERPLSLALRASELHAQNPTGHHH